MTLLAGKLVIPLLRRLKAGQPVLEYVETHKQKNGTPTMGGLFFIVSATLCFFAFGGGKYQNAVVAVTFGLAFMVVGFIDDYLKIHNHKNEGLKAYQKILFQTAISVVAGLYVYRSGLTQTYIPFTEKKVDLGVFAVILAGVIFIAITNSVNLTDGLDGLAGGTSTFYLLFMAVLIYLQSSLRGDKFGQNGGLILLSVSLIGAICGFLVFNVSKASVFMGDSGSLSLGGFIGAISIFSSNSLFIPLLGITFVASSVSVIIQVIYFKKTKKRVFLMSPIHHHFQMKGYSESKIAFCYSLITIIMGALSIISYL